MYKFKEGDIVKIKSGNSTDSMRLHGKVGKIIERHESAFDRGPYYILDIERKTFGEGGGSGIWEYELTRIDEIIPTIYGIAKWCKENYK